jgi:adenylate cyclase
MEKISIGDFESAARLFAQASKVRGDDLQSKMMLMSALLKLDREADMRATAKEAIDTAERRLGLNPDDSRAAYIGAIALIHLGDQQRALDWLDIAARIDADDPRTTYNLACAYSLLGESEKALDFLEFSIKAGRPVRMCEWAMIDPDLAHVRENPRFGALIEGWRAQATSKQA